MNIHPIWYICLFFRFSLAYCIYNNILNTYLLSILLFMSIGFFYKGCTGPDNERQISKVFWHDSRNIHGILYPLSFYYLLNNNYKMSSLLVILDILFSISYRIIFNK